MQRVLPTEVCREQVIANIYGYSEVRLSFVVQRGLPDVLEILVLAFEVSLARLSQLVTRYSSFFHRVLAIFFEGRLLEAGRWAMISNLL